MEDKVYFTPGSIVQLRLDIPNKPLMVVIKKESNMFKDTNNLKGIRCMWFTTTGELQQFVFNTKDLQLIKEN